MAREVSIIVAVKNAVKLGLSKTWKDLQDFGQSAMRIGKFFATGFLAAGTAVAGFAAKALGSYAVVEKGQRALEGAFTAFGEEVPVNVEKVKQFTAAIQDETGADGDALVAQAARLRMLGVQANQLEAATKATVALKSAGMEEGIATKAIAQAYMGNYTALSKYIPAVRAATTEQEKAAALNDFVAKGYEQQKSMLNTVSGQWGLLKERVGDAWEEMGKAIEQNGTLSSVIGKASGAVKGLVDRFKEWAGNGGMTNFIISLVGGLEEMWYKIQTVGNGFRLMFSIVKDGAETAVTYFVNVFQTGFYNVKAQIDYLGNAFGALWQKIKHPIDTDLSKIMPSTKAMKGAMDDFQNALMGKNALVTENTKATLDAQEALEKTHADRIASISKWQLDMLAQQNTKRTSDTAVAVAAEEQLEQEAATSVEAAATNLTEKIAETLETRKGNEKAALDEIVDLHEAAAGEASNAWKQVDPLAGIAGDRTARDESKWSKGGTFTTTKTVNKNNPLLGSGSFADFTRGSSLGGSIADELSFSNSEKILSELQKMNKNQEKLFTYG
jgi:hypothetical protein